MKRSNKVKIKFHGHLGENVGKEWNLRISSVSEGIHAIQTLTNKLYSYLFKKDKEGAKYRVLINGKDFKYAEKPDINNLESIKTSELMMKMNLETVDIVPIIEGADDFAAIALGLVLIVAGVFTFGAAFAGASLIGGAMIVGGIGLVAAGVINLLSSPPKFEDFREIGGGGKVSYLFNGPVNITNEGGPVPVLYGRLLVGSQVVGASYEITDKDATNTDFITNPLTV